MSNILSKIAGFFHRKEYAIGFFISSDYLPLSKTGTHFIKWLNTNGYKKGWFADPFILDYKDGTCYVLVEEYLYSCYKGRISCLIVDHRKDEFVLREVKPIIELDTHLSFPFIIKDGIKTFICPENYQSGCVSLYELDPISLTIKSKHIIINDPLVDVQLFNVEDVYYALGTLTKTGAMDETKILRLYQSDSLLGEYRLIQVINNELKEERGAGGIALVNDNYIRPVQSCEGGYGKCVIFRYISVIDGLLRQKEILRLKPNQIKKWGLALHTYNWSNSIAVVDGQDYSRVFRVSRVLDPLLMRIAKWIKS